MMRFARWTFAGAGIYGLIATLSLYFQAPLSPATQWLYAFAGAAAATQLAYLIIATDPVRFRPVIPVGIASKLSFAVPMTLLYAHGELPVASFAFALIDYALAILFAANFVMLGRQRT
jgi:hypothetical protein